LREMDLRVKDVVLAKRDLKGDWAMTWQTKYGKYKLPHLVNEDPRQILFYLNCTHIGSYIY